MQRLAEQMVSVSGGLVHIVDDDDPIRRSLQFLLQAVGYRVECWTSGEQFLKSADRNIPACVIMDVRMPGIDGIQVQERMTRLGFDFPVILMTGACDIEFIVNATMAGVVSFMQKPFDRARLLREVTAAFDRLADRVLVREEETLASAQIARLDDNERRVLDGLACGLLNKTIARDLGLSLRDVEMCRAMVMEKLDVTYLADALRIALKGRLGSEPDWRSRHGAASSLPTPPGE
jgi:two-component system response regulator FixJ